MTKRLLILFISLLNVGLAFAQCGDTFKFIDLLVDHHYQPRNFDLAFSNDVFDNFIDQLDPVGMFFTIDDAKRLSLHKDKIHLYIENKDCHFLDEITAIYSARLNYLATIIDGFLKNEIDFQKNESITLVKDRNSLTPLDEKALGSLWKRHLKYILLQKIYTTENILQKEWNDLSERRSKIQRSVHKGIMNDFREIIDDPLKMHNFVRMSFNNAISVSFDPHTSYFSADSKSSFWQALSYKESSFGFEYAVTSTGEIMISDLLPGSTASANGDLSIGDVVLNVRYPNGKDEDVSLMDIEEFAHVLDNPKDTLIEMQLRKENGAIITTWLSKGYVAADGNLLRSFILDGNEKVGYVKLPVFYSGYDGSPDDATYSLSGCATDLSKELLKLNKAKISGLIIDLRDNTGGYMEEALQILGLLIDWGPLVLYQNKVDEPIPIRDLNRGMAYYGPLIVMVNRGSASASEVVAATLQDYNRAVIVGERTFGKATSQEVFEIKKDSSSDDAFGYAKITISRMLRISQKDYQKHGVLPDIEILSLNVGASSEEDAKNSLNPTLVTKKTAFNKMPEYPISFLKTKSELRQNTAQPFLELKTKTDSISALLKMNSISIPLTPNEFRKYVIQKRKDIENLSDLGDFELPYKVIVNVNEKQLMSISSHQEKIYKNMSKSIERDIQIAETFHIMLDYLNKDK